MFFREFIGWIEINNVVFIMMLFYRVFIGCRRKIRVVIRRLVIWIFCIKCLGRVLDSSSELGLLIFGSSELIMVIVIIGRDRVILKIEIVESDKFVFIIKWDFFIIDDLFFWWLCNLYEKSK